MKKILLAALGLAAMSGAKAQDIKAYLDYDFVAGDKILFEDNFSADKEAAIPSRWKLTGGEAAILSKDEAKVVSIKQYYTSLMPAMKTTKYLPDAYTVELDCWLDPAYESNPGIMIDFRVGDESVAAIRTSWSKTECSMASGNQSGDNPDDIKNENFFNKWHHLAVAYNNKQLDIYVNQHHVLSIPDCGFKAEYLVVNGDASGGAPMYFKNFKLAAGSNNIAKALSSGKFVSHGILFDVNKSNIRPESMGVLNEVADYLKANTAVVFEVGGHTDSDGDDASNLKLSQARAESVKKQLIAMGVKETQLTTNGYGESNPIDSNTTSEGKANNRRVEFVKK